MPNRKLATNRATQSRHAGAYGSHGSTEAVQLRYRLRINVVASQMKNTFVVISSAGSNRDHSKSTREQPLWDQHAAFIDQLVTEGFVLMGGPFIEEGGSMLVVSADNATEVQKKLKNDPWMKHHVLKLESIKHWQIFIDVRT
jgi:uncharacterized protein